MVERLKCDDSACEHWPHPEGDLVRFEDYEALEVNALRELAAAQTAYVARGMELRDAQDRLAEQTEVLLKLARFMDSFREDGLRPDEWLLKEWAEMARKAAHETARAIPYCQIVRKPFTKADQPTERVK